ncbi:MAG: sialate O-acetylesterase, partial [Opitutae bacterium]|nr:sialate O-acetylesterase [Opitutae bacterium]
MKIYSLIIAMIFGAALASPGTVLVSDHFDNNTIAGSGVGNTMTLNDGWDVDLTSSASSNLTSVGTGFSTATGSMVGADDVFSRGFSFTFTPGDSYHLASLRVKAGHASGGGQNRSATSDLSVTISNGGTNIFTQAVSYTNPNGQFVNVFFAPGVTTLLDSATQYTVTVLASNTTSGGPVYDFVELQADPVRDLTYTALPRDLQVVPRDRATDTAVVPISGEVVVGTPEEIILRVYRDDVLSSETSQALVYVDGAAPFLFAPVIAAELNNYDFEVFLVHGGVETSVTRVEDVVAGDVFIIQGQSNADAQMYNGSASENENPFLRSFGLNSEDGTITEFDLSWRTAKGDGSRDVEGGVGQWGLRMGSLLVDTHNIPIAILNGAKGAQSIDYFERNDADAADRTTNYGRLLYRAQMAGVTNAVRAILWYQGESDNGDGATHETGFIALSDDWRVDYPQVERIYIHQLHVGCGVTKEEVDLRDRQRR